MLRYDGMAGLIGIPTWEPVPLEDLHGRVERAFFCSQTERWSEMGPLVPGLIADAWNLVHGAETEDRRREAFALQALVYRVASGMLDRLGETRLPWVAAERSMFAAEQTGDPLLIAGGAWRMTDDGWRLSFAMPASSAKQPM